MFISVSTYICYSVQTFLLCSFSCCVCRRLGQTSSVDAEGGDKDVSGAGQMEEEEVRMGGGGEEVHTVGEEEVGRRGGT